MISLRKAAAMAGTACGLAVRLAAGQALPAASPPADSAAPVLTLSSPMMRTTMGKMNLGWLFPSQVPDFRMKMERPEWGSLTAAEMEGRLRGVELRLPMEGLWVGYEKAVEGEEPRATLSIQRGF